ncbi:MAG: phage tail protein, partial [Fervidobacterium sp.]
MTVGELVVKLGADMSGLDKSLSDAENKVQRSGTRIGSIFKTAIGTAIGFSLASFGKQILDFVKDITMTAGRTQALEYAMFAVADATGYGAKAATDAKNALKESNIAEQEAVKITTRLMQAQIDLSYATKLSKTAQDAAIIANMGSSEAAERLVEAIAKQRPELLDAFGFTKSLNSIMRDYAATTGKNISQLTEYDRRMAMLNYILQEGQKIAGAYDRAMSSPFKRWGSFTSRILPDFKSKLGEVMLPLFNLFVTGLSNAVKTLSTWIEQNKTTIIAWGQTFANIISQIWTFLVTAAGIIARQWNALRPIIIGVAWAFVSFRIAAIFITAAEWATRMFTLAMAILSGEAIKTSGILAIVSRAIQIYRLQLHLASMSGITHIGIIQLLRTALYSLWAALGPVGWAIIALSAALTAGIGLWTKYSMEVERSNMQKIMDAQNKAMKGASKGASDASKGMENLADSTKDASKSAKGNLQSFDEIHSVMQDMGTAEPQLPDLGNLGNLGDLAKMPGIDLNAIEQAKPTLAGFWDWIKQGFATALDGIKGKISNVWDWIKEKTGNTWDWVKEKTSNVWEWLKTNVGPYLEPITQLIGTVWNNLKTITVDVFQAIKDFIFDTFKNIFTFVVDIVKATVDFVVSLWNNLSQFAKNIFIDMYSFISGTWQNIKQFATNIWKSISDFVIGTWQNIKTFAGNVWTNISDLIKGKIDLRTFIVNIWGAIKDFLFNQWNLIKDFGFNIWTAVNDFIRSQWTLTKQFTSQLWNDIKNF